MITIARLLSISIPLIWCGMIAAISFIEAPLKFQAPGVTLPALGILLDARIMVRLSGIIWVIVAVLYTYNVAVVIFHKRRV